MKYHLFNDINNKIFFKILHKTISETITNFNRFLFQNFENEKNNLNDFDLKNIDD